MAKSDDPTLAAALDELKAEGKFDEGATVDAFPDEGETIPPETPEPDAPADPAPEPEVPDNAKSDVAAEPAAEPEVVTDPDDDPLAGTTPFQYSLDGQARVFDAILEIEGQGGIIPPDKMEQVRNVFAYAEKAAVERDQLNERLAKYEEALTAKNGDAELRGTEAFDYLRAEVDRMNAGGTILWNALRDPELIVTLGYAMQQGDQAAIEKVLANVQRDLKSAVLEANYNHLTARTTPQAPSPEAQAQQRTTAVSGAIRTIAKQYPGLTPDDLTAADRAFAPLAQSLVRPATAQDVAKWPNSGFKTGDLIVDRQQMESWLQERADWRSAEAKKEQDRKARETAADAAGKFNRRQQNGRQPAKSAGTTPAAPAPTTPSARPSRAAAWNEPLAAFLEEAGIPGPGK